MDFNYPYGATPLDPEEGLDLIPSYLQTQKELNEWEQRNIIDAQRWVFARKHSQLLTINFCCQLHHKMFNKTWKWAGQFRHSNKNIGVPWELVPQQLKILLDDAGFQLNHDTYPTDEIAARLHHRLVSIHPFPNGNGRHSRLFTDALLFSIEQPKFSWGSQTIDEESDVRKNYLKSLRSADCGDYNLLLQFVRS